MATVGFYLDPRRPLADGTLPLRVRVTHDRLTRYFETIFSFTEKEWEKISSGYRLNESQRIISDSLNAELKRARDIIDDLKFFSFPTFKLRFTQKGDRKDLISLLESRSLWLISRGKVSDGTLFGQAAKMFRAYRPNEKIVIDSVTPQWLMELEMWAVSKGYTYTTIAMYLGRVRTIFNEVIKLKELSRDQYPFGRDKYKIPKATNNKRPLTIDEIMTLFQYKPETDKESFAKDMFMFSYLANGMNLYDVFNLKWDNFQGDSFSFIRKKNENRPSARVPVNVLLDEHLREIIQRRGVKGDGGDYVFPVLQRGMPIDRELKLVRATITKVNIHLKRIAKKIGINEKISSYFARHSYATIMMEVAPVAQISRDLGHTSIQTTQNYLDQLPAAKRVEHKKHLLKLSTAPDDSQ